MNDLMFSSIVFICAVFIVKPSIQDISVELLRVNCTQTPSIDAVYLTKRDDDSSVHILWSGLGHYLIPSVLIAHSSDANDTVEVKCSGMYPRLSLHSVSQSYAVAFVKLVEYNDTNEVVNFSKPMKEIKLINFKELNWQIGESVVNHVLSDDELFESELVGKMEPSVVGGSVNIRFMVSASNRRNPACPQLVFLPGMSLQVDFSLVKLKTSYSASRFGVQLAVISNQTVRQNEDFAQETIESLDDEFTPGNFKTINLKLADRADSVTRQPINLPGSLRSTPPAFLQLRPVCYATNGSRDVESSRNVLFDDRRSIPSLLDLQELRNTTVFWFYGDPVSNESLLSNSDTVGIRLQNVSFGTQKDGFYASSGYLVWTFSLGLGTPPVYHFSVLLIALFVFSMVLAIGTIVLGTISTVIVRRRRRCPQSERLIDSDCDQSTPVA